MHQKKGQELRQITENEDYNSPLFSGILRGGEKYVRQ
jgi:hypothetical protein